MKGIVEHVREFLIKNLIGKRIGIGVSGGADSITLLDAVCSLNDYSVFALHFDHAVRPESGDDAKFVEEFAKSLGVECVIERMQKEGKEISENKLRRARYDFFERNAKRLKLNAILTAHTANDQAETVLFRIMRGTGIHGMKGIPSIRDAEGFVFLRPLIDVRRTDIMRYISNRNLEYREDSSNLSDMFFRNRIRNQILPFLIEHSQCDIIGSLNSLAESAKLDEDFFYSIVERELHLWSMEDEKISVPLRIIKELHPALRSRCIHSILNRIGIFPARDVIESIEDIIAIGGRCDLSEGVSVWINHSNEDRLTIGRPIQGLCLSINESALSDLGETIIPSMGLKISVKKKEYRKDIAELKRSEIRPKDLQKPWAASANISEESVVGRLIVRTRLQGDRLQPFGMTGTKKLQDIFIDEKIPLLERDLWPLLCDDEGVLWIIGVKQAERTRVPKHAEEILHIEVHSDGLPNDSKEIA
ncbi:TPA: tRNA lysidine(34) synthetase TilS [bacterium]|nr:MAG: tRNA lysidine(34) synthetase TilS [Candidatus Hydrogenedentes bacterium CG1_02_42_14]PIU47357.1 MAG: tRNA lysidine(34) synthetase TilS [Candidatus Hydrogenedentes bacterium CG07_land_8_20_14_0_80_42_17]HBW47585.1 tRNA lysidine(34) synthetase TilS [bacterium]